MSRIVLNDLSTDTSMKTFRRVFWIFVSVKHLFQNNLLEIVCFLEIFRKFGITLTYGTFLEIMR